jgi:3-hydroxyisobutyrate dehydrogenase-like beta-hydroxyacid dehydrogenase
VKPQNVGILHPGQMGISIAASAQNSGYDVYWVSDGRSAQTHERAEKHNLKDANSLAELCEACSFIICVCPPHAAEEVAIEVAEHGFLGLYVDANAISPQRTRLIEKILVDAGATFVDGSIIGGPAWEPKRTWLYLSGDGASLATSYFSEGPLETSVIGEQIGKASAIKMCFAAYTKGTTALLSAILATAEAHDVREELNQQWSRYWPDFAEETAKRVKRGATRAWRFAGEMDEIADTFDAAGMPGDFHDAAAKIFRRTSHFKDDPSPELGDVLSALLRTEKDIEQEVE